MELKESAVKNWANKIPFGFKEFVKGMANENRIAIASLLMKKDELRFSEIQEKLDIPKNLLSQHLKVLLKYGLIRRTKSYWTDEEKVFKSNYKLNPIYRDLIKANISQLRTPLLKRSDDFIRSIEFQKQDFKIVGLLKNEERNPIKGEIERIEIWSQPDNTGEEGKWIKIK